MVCGGRDWGLRTLHEHTWPLWIYVGDWKEGKGGQESKFKILVQMKRAASERNCALTRDPYGSTSLQVLRTLYSGVRLYELNFCSRRLLVGSPTIKLYGSSIRHLSRTVAVLGQFWRTAQLCHGNLHGGLRGQPLISTSSSCMIYGEAADVVPLDVIPGTLSRQPH